MNVITIIQGIRFPILVKLVFRRGITPLPLYIIRFLVLLMASFFSSVLTLVEKVRYGPGVKETRLENPPVFIVGHWRTGSTFLHQLMALDPRFTALTMVQAVIPEHFLFSSKYYGPILKKVLPKTRPMDNVALSPDAPQEEEWSLIRLGAESPLEKILFPPKKKFFLKDDDQYIPEGRQLEKFRKNLDLLYRRITLQTGLRIVSKNPCHSMRIPLLAGMYPGAKFIHIHRDPLEVVPSTIRMWNIMARDNALKRGWHSPSAGEVSAVNARFVDFIRKEGAKLETGHFCEVAFRDLEKDPQAELQKLYSCLGLEFSDEFRTAVDRFIEANRNYRRNSYTLSEADRKAILEVKQ